MGASGETGKGVMHLRLCLSLAVSTDLAKTPWEKQPENECGKVACFALGPV